MLPDTIGVSFLPTVESAALGPRRGALQGLGEAIQTLSLRLPRVLGARALAPEALLTARGGGGMDVSAVVASIIRDVLGANAPGVSLAPSRFEPGVTPEKFREIIGSLGSAPKVTFGPQPTSFPSPPQEGAQETFFGLPADLARKLLEANAFRNRETFTGEKVPDFTEPLGRFGGNRRAF